MPKGYVIAHAEVTNPEKWAEYVAKSKIALDKFGGKPIVRGNGARSPRDRGARATWCSISSYEAAEELRTRPSTPRQARQGAGTIDIVIVEGFEALVAGAAPA
jgi:uncharacterized protein (DUF1330 family)